MSEVLGRGTRGGLPHDCQRDLTSGLTASRLGSRTKARTGAERLRRATQGAKIQPVVSQSHFGTRRYAVEGPLREVRRTDSRGNTPDSRRWAKQQS